MEEYQYQFIFAMVGGLLLFITNHVGSAAFYIMLTEYVVEYGLISENYAMYFKAFFMTLAYLGGITVMIGAGILGYIGIKKIGNWFITTGTGISTTVLIIRLVNMGPLLRYYFLQKEYGKIFMELGIGGLQGAGVIFALLALLSSYRLFILAFIDGMMLIVSGVLVEPIVIMEYMKRYLPISVSMEV